MHLLFWERVGWFRSVVFRRVHGEVCFGMGPGKVATAECISEDKPAFKVDLVTQWPPCKPGKIWDTKLVIHEGQLCTLKVLHEKRSCGYREA